MSYMASIYGITRYEPWELIQMQTTEGQGHLVQQPASGMARYPISWESWESSHTFWGFSKYSIAEGALPQTPRLEAF